jgi:hypothetical protein
MCSAIKAAVVSSIPLNHRVELSHASQFSIALECSSGVKQNGHCLGRFESMKSCRHSLPMKWPHDENCSAWHGTSSTSSPSSSPKTRRQMKQRSSAGGDAARGTV